MDQDIDWIAKARQTKEPKDVVHAFLLNSGKNTVRKAAEALVAEDADYVSLNFQNSELEAIEPWTGTRKGRDIYINTFSNVGTYWDVNDFQITDLISDGELVAAFGSFTYTSVELRHQFTSPLAIKAIVKNGLITYMQFMEDTYASARSFRKSGSWEIQNNGRTFTLP